MVWEDPLEKEMATHSSIAWRIPWREETGGYTPWGHRESDRTEPHTHTHTHTHYNTDVTMSSEVKCVPLELTKQVFCLFILFMLI